MVAPTSLAARAVIEVDGSALDPAIEIMVEEVVVDDHLHRPDMFTIRLRDVELDALSKGRFTIGAEVKISGRGAEEPSPTVLIVGEVTALEGDYYSGRATAIVRGYDKSHRLHLGRRTATYADETDADIAKEVAQRAEIDVGTVDDTDVQLPLVSQPNLTDWEFLHSRAALYGYEVSVSDGKLHFRAPTESADAPDQGEIGTTNPRQLVFRQNLIEFRPRISAAGQVSTVRVRGWDPGAKEELKGEAEPNAPSAGLSTSPTDLAGTFGDQVFVSVDRALSTQAEVDAAAEALAQQVGTAFAEATGIAEGHPILKAGVAVSVSEVAETFAGRYTLTHTRHVFNQVGYRTHFEISGAQDRSLYGLIAGGGGGAQGGPSGRPIYGMVTAIVTNNDGGDEHPAEVKLWFPWLSDKEGDGAYESGWARIVQLGAGPDSGAVWLPEVNDEVLVAFEHGDISRPYVIGGLYNGQDTPNLGDGLVGSDGAVKRRGFVSRKGHAFIFFDDDSKSGMAMITDGKMRVSLNDTNKKLRIATKEGEILIEADKKDITISAAVGKLKLSGKGGIEIGDGSSQVTIKGSTIALN